MLIKPGAGTTSTTLTGSGSDPEGSPITYSIFIPRLSDTEEAQLFIQDMSGKTSLETKVKQSSTLNRLSPGLYLMRIRSRDVMQWRN